MDNKQKKIKITTVFTIGFSILPAVGGSIITFMYLMAAFAGLANVTKRDVSHRLNRYEKFLIYPALCFFIVNVLSVVREDFVLTDLEAVLPSVLFLLLYFAVKRYSYTSNEYQFLLLVKAVPYGAFLLLPWIIYHSGSSQIRLEAGSGNAIPFAMICAMMAPISLMNLYKGDIKNQLISIAACVIFLIGLIFSQSRGMMIAAMPNMLFAIGYLLLTSGFKIRTISIVMLSLLVMMATIIPFTGIATRMVQLEQSFSAFYNGAQITEKSVSERIELLRKGLCFAQNKPIFGYGISNRDEVLASDQHPARDPLNICNQDYSAFGYSHFHNGFLTAFIDAGAIGLISTMALLLSPLVMSLISPNDQIKSKRITIALCLTSVYMAAAMTNLLFGQDLIDAIFLIFSMFLLISIPKNGGQKIN